MTRYEYKVVPAPTKGTKAKGVKTPQGRFARSVETVLNQMGAEGWEYLRAELLPSEERSGLTGSTTNWRNVLVFRRPLAEEAHMAAQPGLVAIREPEPEQQLPDEPAVEAPPVGSRSGIQVDDEDGPQEETADTADRTEARDDAESPVNRP